MNLSASAAYAVAEGRKTEHRIPYRRGKNLNLQIGKCYPVTIKGERGRVATVRITWFERVPLVEDGANADQDAIREGYGGLHPAETRRRLWVKQYGSYDPEQEVWLVKFELVAAEGKAA